MPREMINNAMMEETSNNTCKIKEGNGVILGFSIFLFCFNYVIYVLLKFLNLFLFI